MGSKIKRFLAVLLAVLMLVSMVPVSALATESEHAHEHISAATTAQVSPASDTEDPDAADPEDPETSEDPEPEENDPPAADPVPGQDQVCYQPGDANSDGEVHVNDAFYVLYNSLMPDQYPMNHSGDYDGSGSIDKNDALLVLKYVHGLAPKPAYTHVYQEPVWRWTFEDDYPWPAVTFPCSCGNSRFFDDLAWETAEEQDATCTENGYATYTATVEFEGATYTNTYTAVHNAFGHAEPTCEAGAACEYCDYAVEATGHTWELTGEEAADCDSLAVYYYTCSACNDESTVEQEEGSFVHQWEYTGDVEAADIACGYVKAYECSVCHTTKSDVEYDAETGEPTNVFYKHTYTAALTTEATCQQPGQKTLTCACGHKEYEEVPVNPEAHTWVLSNTETAENGVVTNTYTCACGETKTAVDASNAAVPKEDLENTNGELTVGDVSISMDTDTMDDLTGNVSVNVGTADKDEIGLSQEQKEQIGNNPVYDFTLTDGSGEVSSFGGEVTISLPYTLQGGDDVDCIDVWFIKDDGTVTIQQGTYSNGFVTFTTNHFSYYTVTQLTPQQRCEEYGHIWQTISKDATCTTNGYSMEVCQRCDDERNSVNTGMLEHAYTVTRTEPTCTANGMEVKTCSSCGDTSRTTLFALGHNMEVTASVAATCTEAGYETKECANGDCAFSQTVQFSALGHNHEHTETVAYTCTAKGYDVYTCSHCGDTQNRNEQPALGHSYQEAADAWSWNDQLTAATVTLVCSHDESHSTTQKAVVSEVIKAASCTAGGTTTYTAKVTYNNVSYENVQHSEQSATGHATASEEWLTTTAKHYRTCDACGIRIDQADHNWGDAEITEASSCVSAGKATYACTVCGFSRQETLPATGIHEDLDSDGACDSCGFREETCTHKLTVEKLMDLTGYNVCEGTRIIELSCECGQEKAYRGDQFVCTWAEQASTYEKQLDNGATMEVNVTSCQHCGIVIESGISWLLLDGTCKHDNTFYEKVSIDGETIVERETHDVLFMGHELAGGITELGNLEAEGFCGAESRITECRCGGWRVDLTNYNCQWVDIESDDPDTTIQLCTVCGATLTKVCTNTYENCMDKQDWVHTLEYNGEVLSTIEAHVYYESHSNDVVYEMHGETCEDGLTIVETCAECGKTNEYDTTYHETVVFTQTLLSDWGNPCMAGVIQISCPCGLQQEYHTLFGPDSDFEQHNWNVIREEGNTTVSACLNCGYTKTSVMTMSEKDENCGINILYTDTISDGGEHSVTVYWTDSVEEHDFIDTYTLLGTSCEDGVRHEETCQDCGFVNYSGVYNYHGGVTVEFFNLSEFGGCNTECFVYECACGKESWWGTEEETCDWEHQGWENGITTYICNTCGITRKDSSKLIGTDGCDETSLITITFSKNGRTVKTVSFSNTTSNHDYIYELTLHEGETGTCEDGYDIHGTCQNCDGTREDTDYYGCTYWFTDRVTSPDGMFCGNLVVDYRNCACGKLVDADINWFNGNCEFQDYYDEENDRWFRRCVNCGIEPGETLVERVPGQATCSYVETRTETYFRDGELVYSVEIRNVFFEHEWIVTYQTEEGFDSCDDGYTLREVCSVCDMVLENFGDNYYNDCAARTIARTLVASREDICGDIYRLDDSCACGANSFATYVMPCPFESDGIDEETGAEKYRCPDCAMRYDILITAETVPGTTCKVATHRTANYYVGDELLFSEESDSVNDDHIQVTGFRLLGETCSEGYYTNNKCAKCGIIFWEDENIYYDGCYDSTYRINQETIYNAECGTTYVQTNSCACGRNTYVDLWSGCDFYEVSSDGNGNEVHRCGNCGIEKRITRSMEQVEGTTCDYLISWTNQFFDGDTLLGTYVSTETETRHTEEYHYELLGKDCDDGYYVSTRCSKCDEALWNDEEVRYGCSTYNTWHYDTPYFADAGACGTYYKVTSSCACGKHQTIRLECEDWRCEMEWIDEVDGVTIERCISCGLTTESRSLGSTEDKGNCITSQEQLITYSMDGTQLGEFQSSSQWSSHSWLHTYELYGETCRDGYTETMTCYFCQKQNTNERVPTEDEPEFECWESLVALEPVLEMDGICGNVYFNTYRCACGNTQYTTWSYSCNFDNTYSDEETGGEYAQCPDCGLIRKYYSETVYNPEACTASDLTHYKFFLNGTECGSYTSEHVREYHQTTATYEMLGTSCTDGFRVTHACRYCDYSRTEEEIHYSHDTFETETYDLSGLDCCGVSLGAYACPCGRVANYGFGSDCSFSDTEETDPNGYSLWECEVCGLQYTHYSPAGNYDIENCTTTNTDYFCFYRDGELLQTVVIPYSDIDHSYVMTDAVLNDPELGCEGGYTVTLQCLYCMDAYTSTSEPGSSHNCYYTDIFYVELEGGCETKYVIDQCACGAERSPGYTYDSCSYEDSSETVVIDGISHNIYTRVCTVCGFTIVEDCFDEPTDDPCKVITNQEITYRYGDKVMTYVGTGENSNHDMQSINSELMDCNTNCDQGVMVTYTCTKCDYTENREEWGHFTYADEVHDLEEYGSVHGGELAHFICACGDVSRYDFQNMTCDLDQTWIENFVDGALNEEWSETAEGSTWIDSEAYLIKCAVTDPQCGLTIRMSEYWLADEATCIATEYQVWQLGYNELTGEYQKEILIPTGETAAYHNYEHTTNSETDAEGNEVTENNYLCSCGSSRYEKQVLYADGRQRNWWDAVNTLNDGRTRERHSHTYYDHVVSGYRYETESYGEHIDAQGETYWSNYVRTYDSTEDPCYYTCTHTGSNEELSTHNDWTHVNNHIWITQPTCSQQGQYCYECDVCGAISETYDHDPYGHGWYFDESLDCYVCGNCNLTNSNGADGNIVMEDLSDEEFYIVGYWVREEMSFEPRAAVVKYNTESGEEEVILLDGVDFTYMTREDDSIVAVSVDKAQVDALVADQITGYEGGYAVRIIFVPTDDQTIMDYALTFDTCYTEGWESTEATEATEATEQEATEAPELPEPTETTEPAA